MKTMTVAGASLVLSLAGCTMTGPGSSSDSGSSMSRSGSSYHSESYAKADSANIHYENFGDPNNMPFDGDYSATW